MDGSMYMILGGVFICIGIFGLLGGQIFLSVKKREIKEKQRQIQEEG